MKRKVEVKDATRAMHFEPDKKKMHRPSVAELRNLIDELPDKCISADFAPAGMSPQQFRHLVRTDDAFAQRLADESLFGSGTPHEIH